MKKILTFILSGDIQITSHIIKEIGCLLSLNVKIEHFNDVSVVVDNSKGDEAAAAAQIIACVTRIYQSEISHITDERAIDNGSPKELISGMQSHIFREIAKSNNRFVIVISKSRKIFAPNKISASIGDLIIGEDIKFEQIFSVQS